MFVAALPKHVQKILTQDFCDAVHPDQFITLVVSHLATLLATAEHGHLGSPEPFHPCHQHHPVRSRHLCLHLVAAVMKLVMKMILILM